MRSVIATLSICVFAGGASAQATAQVPGAQAELDDVLARWKFRDWRLEITPGVWRPALDGNLTLSTGAGVGVGVGTEAMDLEDNDISPHAQARLRFDDWELALGGFGFSTSAATTASRRFTLAGLTVNRGAPFSASYDLDTFQATIGRVWAFTPDAGALAPHPTGVPTGSPAGANAGGVEFQASVFAGFRAYDVDFFLASAAQTRRADETWVEPLVGAGLSIEAVDHFTLDVGVSAGGLYLGDDDLSSSFDVWVGVHWRPETTWGAQFGWRQLVYDLERDGAEFDNSLAGLFLTLVVRF